MSSFLKPVTPYYCNPPKYLVYKMLYYILVLKEFNGLIQERLVILTVKYSKDLIQQCFLKALQL